MKKIERRTYQVAEIRAKAESRTVEGYAALFDSRSQNLGGFTEIIEEGAFDDVLEDDVRALLNHDANYVLARTKSGTLELSVDEKGLLYRFEAPNTTAGNDLLESIRRGDISQSSFGFSIKDDDWDYDTMTRTIKKVKRLYDVSPVTYPAYEQTEVTARSLEAAQKKDTPKTLNLYKSKLKILQLAG